MSARVFNLKKSILNSHSSLFSHKPSKSHIPSQKLGSEVSTFTRQRINKLQEEITKINKTGMDLLYFPRTRNSMSDYNINEEDLMEKIIKMVPNKSKKIRFQKGEPTYFSCNLFGTLFPANISFNNHLAIGQIYVSFSDKLPSPDNKHLILKIGKTRFEKPSKVKKADFVYFCVFSHVTFESFISLNFQIFDPKGLFESSRNKVEYRGKENFEIDFEKFNKYFEKAIKPARRHRRNSSQLQNNSKKVQDAINSKSKIKDGADGGSKNEKSGLIGSSIRGVANTEDDEQKVQNQNKVIAVNYKEYKSRTKFLLKKINHRKFIRASERKNEIAVKNELAIMQLELKIAKSHDQELIRQRQINAKKSKEEKIIEYGLSIVSQRFWISFIFLRKIQSKVESTLFVRILLF